MDCTILRATVDLLEPLSEDQDGRSEGAPSILHRLRQQMGSWTPTKSKVGRTVRVFMHWLRRWLKTSKPTEWLTGTSALVALLTGLSLYRSAVIDTKSAAADAKSQLVKIQEIQLESRKETVESLVSLLKSENTRLAEQRNEIDKQQSLLKSEQEALERRRQDISKEFDRRRDQTAKLQQENEKNLFLEGALPKQKPGQNQRTGQN
jgi:hypothetical protein